MILIELERNLYKEHFNLINTLLKDKFKKYHLKYSFKIVESTTSDIKNYMLVYKGKSTDYTTIQYRLLIIELFLDWILYFNLE